MIDFIHLAIIFITSFFITFILKILNQPLIIAYIIAGIFLSNFFISYNIKLDVIDIFAELGIAFLLFIVGLELKLKNLREIGKAALVIGILQEILTVSIGFVILKAIGFNNVESFYIALALSFSSTIIMLKLINDKGDLNKTYGKLSIGFLLVQDLITILVIFILPFIYASDVIDYQQKGSNIIIGLLALLLVPLASLKIFPKIEGFLSSSQEFLFLFSLAFSLGIGALFKYLKFGLEAGALIAGISLSSLTSSVEIASKLKPVRDFFLILFFIFIGTNVFINNIPSEIIWQAVLLSLFVLIGNPLIMILFLVPLGYSLRTSFLLGLTSAQISEFSFILIKIGQTFNQLNSEVMSLLALIGIITILASSYFFVYADRLYLLLRRFFFFLERKPKPEKEEIYENYDVILIGCDRTGFSLLQYLLEKGYNILVIDFDDYKIKQLQQQKIKAVFGDASEIEFLNLFAWCNVSLVISTVPDYSINIIINEKYKKENKEGIFIATAHRIKDAFDLYKANCNYVLMPYFLGADYLGMILADKNNLSKEFFNNLKNNHLQQLKEKEKLNYEHP